MFYEVLCTDHEYREIWQGRRMITLTSPLLSPGTEVLLISKSDHKTCQLANVHRIVQKGHLPGTWLVSLTKVRRIDVKAASS